MAATAGQLAETPVGGLSSAQVAGRAARQGRPEAGDGHLRAGRIRSRCRGTALQALRDQARVQPGQQVLINGASGGLSTFAVQIAKVLGAEMTGACSTRNAGLVKSIGADAVIDYTRDDFTRGPQRFDVILDNVANHPLSHCRRVLTPKGTWYRTRTRPAAGSEAIAGPRRWSWHGSCASASARSLRP